MARGRGLAYPPRNCQTSCVSRDDGWQFDQERLAESLALWHKTNPDQSERGRVNEWLMDLLLDPLHKGHPDPDQPEIFHGRVGGTNIGVLYVVSHEKRRVYVALISEA